jgi:ATP-GRASP peptide maturase of grasp-with-spasm system
MILVLSISTDACTDDVLRWVKYFGHDFVRINPQDKVEISRVELEQDFIQVELIVNKEKEVRVDEISSYWYRRGDLNIVQLQPPTNHFESGVIQYLEKEAGVIQNLIYGELEKKLHINKRNDNETNKLINLINAAKCNLVTPGFTLVTKHTKILNKKDVFITKAMKNGGFRIKDYYGIGGATKRVEELNPTNFPSFIQKEIKKKYEIRVFYLFGETYSVAIFSQQSEQTKVDFRNYDRNKPNRCVPFDLPKYLKVNIKKFMDLSDLNCGSLDFIYSTDDQFVFLEVNPIGQFQQVSIPGNYYLDKIIAEKLCQTT